MTQPFTGISSLKEGYLLPHTLLPAEQWQFRLNGYTHIDGLWDRRLSVALAQEAGAKFATAQIPTNGPLTPVDEERSQRRGTRAATGPLLSQLHVSLIGLVRALSGKLLVPTFAAYGYYEEDDETLLHLDTFECDLTLLTTAMGAVGPLRLRPELRGLSMDKLGELEADPAWDRFGGLPVTYPAFGVTALAGNLMPHNRPGKPLHQPSAVAALCYRSLW